MCIFLDRHMNGRHMNGPWSDRHMNGPWSAHHRCIYAIFHIAYCISHIARDVLQVAYVCNPMYVIHIAHTVLHITSVDGRHMNDRHSSVDGRHVNGCRACHGAHYRSISDRSLYVYVVYIWLLCMSYTSDFYTCIPYTSDFGHLTYYLGMYIACTHMRHVCRISYVMCNV